MANILKVKDGNNNAKNSTTFSNFNRNFHIEDDEIMVSLDVTSLYTNFPRIDTLNIIKYMLIMMINLLGKGLYLKTSFLVYLVLTTTWYTFNSQSYQQTDGVTMIGPASSTTAEIYMQAYERTPITSALHPPKVWEQFVDDVYYILNVHI